MVFLQSKLYFSKDSEGVQPGFQRFPGGGPTFSRGGIRMLISIETHITCDFQGVRTPYLHSGSADMESCCYFFICESSFVVADYNS